MAKYPDGSIIMDEHVTAEHVAELSAENKRLRTALEDMVWRWEIYCGGPDLPHGGHADRALVEKARKALAQTPPTGTAN